MALPPYNVVPQTTLHALWTRICAADHARQRRFGELTETDDTAVSQDGIWSCAGRWQPARSGSPSYSFDPCLNISCLYKCPLKIILSMLAGSDAAGPLRRLLAVRFSWLLSSITCLRESHAALLFQAPGVQGPRLKPLGVKAAEKYGASSPSDGASVQRFFVVDEVSSLSVYSGATSCCTGAAAPDLLLSNALQGSSVLSRGKSQSIHKQAVVSPTTLRRPRRCPAPSLPMTPTWVRHVGSVEDLQGAQPIQ